MFPVSQLNILFIHLFWLCWIFIAVCGLSLVVVHGFLVAVAYLVAEQVPGPALCSEVLLELTHLTTDHPGISTLDSQTLELSFSKQGSPPSL